MYSPPFASAKAGDTVFFPFRHYYGLHHAFWQTRRKIFEKILQEESMRCTSRFIVALRGIEAGGDLQPTQNPRKRQKAPVCKTQTGAEEL